MADGAQRWPEEFYGQCLTNARVLSEAARRHSADQRIVEAVWCAWGADVYTVQAVLWERILVASPSPYRKYFRAAEAMFGMASSSSAQGAASAAALVLSGRAELVADFDPEAREEAFRAWAPLDYLAALPAPTADAFESAAEQRLGGVSPQRFISDRIAAAQEGIADAQAVRVRGDVAAAVERVFDSDLQAAEAYLVESAVASGDAVLSTVTIRWELILAAIARLQGLPDGFMAATDAIRAAIASALPDADAARLRAYFVPVSVGG